MRAHLLLIALALAAPTSARAQPGATEPIIVRDPDTYTLAAAAHTAGIRGDCVGAAAFARRILAVDPDYYAAAIATDPVIAGCRAAAPPPPRADADALAPRPEMPPLSMGKAAGELAVGGLVGAGGALLGIYLGMAAECGSCNSPDGDGLEGLGGAILGGLIGVTVATPLGVILVGNSGDERGSVAGAFGGAALGTVAGLGALALSGSGTIAVLALGGPAIGATIGFNMSRRYTSGAPQVGSLLRLDHGLALGVPMPLPVTAAQGQGMSFSLASGAF